MAARQFSSEGLLVDVQFGDPVLVTVVGVVSVSSQGALQDALSAISAFPGRPDVEVNIVLARFDDDGVGRASLHEAAQLARRKGQRFRTNFLGFEWSTS